MDWFEQRYQRVLKARLVCSMCSFAQLCLLTLSVVCRISCSDERINRAYVHKYSMMLLLEQSFSASFIFIWNRSSNADESSVSSTTNHGEGAVERKLVSKNYVNRREYFRKNQRKMSARVDRQLSDKCPKNASIWLEDCFTHACKHRQSFAFSCFFSWPSGDVWRRSRWKSRFLSFSLEN